MDGGVAAQLDNRIIDGQVNMDVSGSPRRSATVTLLDPSKSPVLDSDSPNDGAMYIDRMLRIWYGVRSTTGEWVDVPIFTGPITIISRSGPTVTVEAQGKEALAVGPIVKPLALPKGMRRVVAIKTLMQAVGEDRFDLPDTDATLGSGMATTVGAQDAVWPAARKIAQAMDRQLFYDGHGTLRLRNHPSVVAWTFHDGDGGTIIDPAELSVDASKLTNIVNVRGRKLKGKHGHIHFTAEIQPPHRLSPTKLGRNGAKRYLNPVFIDNEHIRNTVHARKVAQRRLRHARDADAAVSLTSLVIPHLEEGDRVKVETDEFTASFRLGAFSIPLTTAGTMTIGFHKQVSAVGSGRR